MISVVTVPVTFTCFDVSPDSSARTLMACTIAAGCAPFSLPTSATRYARQSIASSWARLASGSIPLNASASFARTRLR